MKAILLIFGFLFSTFLQARDLARIEETFPIDNEKLSIKLDFDAGEIKFRKGDDATICKVLLIYEAEKCKGEVNYDEQLSELEIVVDYDNFPFKNNDELHAKLEVELPYKTELDLDIRIKAGEVDLQLGDLAIRNFELDNWAGEMNVEFDQPNKIECNTFDVNCKVGELKMIKLGNANFSEAEIDGGVGEMVIDFSGQKIKRSVAHIDLDIGETQIILPDNIGIKMKVTKFMFLSNVTYPDWFNKEGSYYYSKNYRDKNDSLYLMISTGIGELSVSVNDNLYY